VLQLGHRQDGVAFRVGAAVGDVDAGVAGQPLEQQRADAAEDALDEVLVLGPQNPGGKDVAPQVLLDLDQVMVPC